jgi:ketosteroid isomerase-like protein
MSGSFLQDVPAIARYARCHAASEEPRQETAMTHARILLALLIGSIVGGGLAVAASQRRDTQVDDATRQALQRVKAAIVEGHRTRDRAALDALYADDFTATDARGDLRTKADLLRALATDHAMAEGRYELGTIRVWGPIAVAAGHGRMVFRNADGTTRVAEYDSVNVFERRGDRWWYVAAFLP